VSSPGERSQRAQITSRRGAASSVSNAEAQPMWHGPCETDVVQDEFVSELTLGDRDHRPWIMVSMTFAEAGLGSALMGSKAGMQ